MKAASIAIPALIALLTVYALIKKVDVYKAFVEGAGEALPGLVSILPYLAAMLTGIELLRGSGALELIINALSPLSERLGIPSPLIPLIVLRPFSGSASLALLKDVLTEHGADGRVGRAASIIVGSTETVFYTVSVYFGAVGVTKTRQAVPAALIAGTVGTALGIILA